MLSLKGASGSSVRVISQSAPTVLGVHSFFKFMIPFGVCMNAMRIGRVVSAPNAGVMASSIGNASAAPAPRKKVRRGIDFLKITIVYPPHLERCTVDDTNNDG